MNPNEPMAVCSLCGAAIDPGQACWLCRREPSVTSDRVGTNPYAASTLPPMETVGSLMPGMFFTLVGGIVIATAALYGIAPGLGILMTVLLTPALIRTMIVIARRQRSGEEIRVGDRTLLLLGSMAAVITAVISAGLAFFVACIAICFFAANNQSFQLGGATLLTLGFAVAGFAFIVTLTMLWRRRS